MKKFGLVNVLMLVVLLTVLLFGCETDSNSVEPETLPGVTRITKSGGVIVGRLVDSEADVVCWITWYRAGIGGIDCLPISETSLRIGD